jgi:transcriptional regulator with XRE-family HTH domain
MPWPSASIALGDLCNRLLHDLRVGVSSGSLTVRRLAREIGVSQPHMQNIMSGKRSLTIQMADRLLQHQQRSVLALASATELGEALRLATTNSLTIRYIPVLPGRLGPSDPFPELKGESGWRHLPPHAVAHVVRPVFAELGSDAELAREFPGATFALLDLSSQVRSRISQHSWYAIQWSGGGWIRRLRLEQGRLQILGQEGLRPMLGPARIELGSSGVEEHVRALVIWMGHDPKQVNPLLSSGYLVPPPAEPS